jgi:ATP-dependent metalloprotease
LRIGFWLIAQELEEVVEFLRNPDKFSNLGGKLPKGVLLTGPPGTGKTMLARAVAGEAGVPFLFASGSQFDEMFVVSLGGCPVQKPADDARAWALSVSENCLARPRKRLLRLSSSMSWMLSDLSEVRKMPCVTLVGHNRKYADWEQHYMKQTLNQLLVELDGFEQIEGVIIIAATNFPESLDKALTRPGRFDRHGQSHDLCQERG